MGKRFFKQPGAIQWLFVLGALAFAMLRPALVTAIKTTSNGENPVTTVDLLTMVVLAFDNPQTSPSNLTPYYGETLDALIAVSADTPRQTIVVLADLDQDGDTHILVLEGGHVSVMDGLPGEAGTWSTAINEYNMGDGATLGHFMRWARDAYPARRSALLYYGHGAPLIPETASGAPEARTSEPVPLPSWVTALPSWVTALPSWVTALPSWVTANPDLTDVHPLSLLSVADLGTALAIATNNGADKIDVVDLVHCFSLTLEQAYEIAPYSKAITGSANYAYFDAEMPAAAARALAAEPNSRKMARSMIAAYDAILPAEGYPRIMTALESSKLLAVKPAFDAMAAALVADLQADPAATRSKLLAAYHASAKYDTTQCAGDWTLGAPDALSDAHSFALALRDSFGMNSAVGRAAHRSAQRVTRAVYGTIAREGQPYFLNNPDLPVWTFDGVGLGLYTDFVGRPDANGTTYVSWHAAYYDGETSDYNPHPFAFIRGEGSTWDDVFAAFWDGTVIDVELCLRTFPQPIEPGEVSADGWVSPQAGQQFAVGSPMQPRINVTTVNELRNIQVRFTVEQDGLVVMSHTMATGYLTPGTHALAADALWTPAAEGPFTISVHVDSGDVVAESNETDNWLQFSGTVAAAEGRQTDSPGAPTAVTLRQAAVGVTPAPWPWPWLLVLVLAGLSGHLLRQQIYQRHD